MGIVTNIIDALRRIGRPVEKSALRRQDELLQGQEILERERQVIRDPLGTAETFRARTAAPSETVVILSDKEIKPIAENASFAGRFIETFLGASAAELTLEELDGAFAAWLAADDKRGYSEEAVVEILGAAFGEYCNRQLNMRWIRHTDQHGTALGVDGVERQFRGFPYHSILKRIADREHGFFLPVFIALRKNSRDASPR
jgi:hypothetical protein